MTFTTRDPGTATDPLGGDGPHLPATLPPARATIEIFDPVLDLRRHEGKAHVRREILNMRPDDGARILAPLPREDAVFWGVTAANGIPVALRARGFPTASAARRDAAAVLSRVADLRALHVHNPATALHSFWLMQGADVALVAGQATGKRTGYVERIARRVLRALRAIEGP